MTTRVRLAQAHTHSSSQHTHTHTHQRTHTSTDTHTEVALTASVADQDPWCVRRRTAMDSQKRHKLGQSVIFWNMIPVHETLSKHYISTFGLRPPKKNVNSLFLHTGPRRGLTPCSCTRSTAHRIAFAGDQGGDRGESTPSKDQRAAMTTAFPKPSHRRDAAQTRDESTAATQKTGRRKALL